jgi:hypothetical protein
VPTAANAPPDIGVEDGSSFAFLGDIAKSLQLSIGLFEKTKILSANFNLSLLALLNGDVVFAHRSSAAALRVMASTSTSTSSSHGGNTVCDMILLCAYSMVFV